MFKCQTCFVAVLIALLQPGLLTAQPVPQDDPDAALDAPLVDWSHAQRVYHQVERWAHAGQVPGAEQLQQTDMADDALLRVSGVVGVRVTLRWLGMNVGVGTAMWQPSDPQAGIDLLLLARQATAGALAALNQRLAAQGAAIDQVAPLLAVDMQVGHSPEAVTLTPEADSDAIYSQFVAGFHGLRLTHTNRGAAQWSAAWPASSLAANMTPRSQLIQMLSDVDLHFDQISAIARPGGPSLTRFEVIHLVRPGRALPIERLTRGNVVLPATSLDSRTLEAMADRLTHHLVRRQRQDKAMAGTYRPSPDRHDPEVAPLAEQALAAYALTRWYAVFGQHTPDTQQQQVLGAISDATDHLARQLLNPQGQAAPPAAAALTLLTLTEAPHLAERRHQRDQIAAWLSARQNNDGSMRVDVHQADMLTVADHALVAAALASYQRQTRDPQTQPRLVNLENWLVDQNPYDDLAALPWMALWQRTRQTPGHPQALREAIDMLIERQIVGQPDFGPADVVGGFDLRARLTPVPAPDWRTGQVLLLLAVAQQPGGVLHADQAQALQTLMRGGLAARFLAQLMFAEPSSYYVRSPEDAIGGVRVSLWDNLLPVEATATALLAVSEFQQTLQSNAAALR